MRLAEDVTLSEIGRRCGVGRAAVVNWRRRNWSRWPAPVGSVGEGSPLFFWPELEPLLIEGGHLADWTSGAPAVVSLPGGAVLLLHSPSLLVRPDWRELGGYVERTEAGLPVRFPETDLELVEFDGQHFAVEAAGVDLSYSGSQFSAFLLLSWLPERQSPAG